MAFVGHRRKRSKLIELHAFAVLLLPDDGMRHCRNAEPTLIGIFDPKHLKVRFYFPSFRAQDLLVQSSNPAAQKEFRMFSWTFDALTGFKPRRARRSAPASKPAVPAPTSEVVIDADLAMMRSEALRRIFPKLSSWYGSRRDARHIEEISDYLSRAANVTDLEQRIRIIERQRHFS